MSLPRKIYIGRPDDGGYNGQESLTRVAIAKIRKQFLFLSHQSNKEIVFEFLNVTGGAIFEGLRLADEIIASRIHTTSIARGNVFSTATFLFLACDKRIGDKNCAFYIHPPSYPSVRATPENPEGKQKLSLIIKMDYIRKGMIRLLENRTSLLPISITAIMSMKKKDAVFKPSHALKAGLIHELIKDSSYAGSQ